MVPFVTSRDLRLPGKDITSPEVFAFGTPYRSLYDTLKRKDEAFFLKNNLLRLAARNATVKAAPQRFQDIEGPDMADFDVVLCFEARVFYSVVEGNSNVLGGRMDCAVVALVRGNIPVSLPVSITSLPVNVPDCPKIGSREGAGVVKSPNSYPINRDLANVAMSDAAHTPRQVSLS